MREAANVSASAAAVGTAVEICPCSPEEGLIRHEVEFIDGPMDKENPYDMAGNAQVKPEEPIYAEAVPCAAMNTAAGETAWHHKPKGHEAFALLLAAGMMRRRRLPRRFWF